jgi:Integrase core domain
VIGRLTLSRHDGTGPWSRPVSGRNRKRVARPTRAAGLQGATLRKFVVTTTSDPQAPKPVDLERRFLADAPDQLWVADITYIPTGSGWLYLAMVLDVCSRKIVGWAMDTNLNTPLILEPPPGEGDHRAATRQRHPPLGSGLPAHQLRVQQGLQGSLGNTIGSVIDPA